MADILQVAHRIRAEDPREWHETARSFICSANYLLGLDDEQLGARPGWSWSSSGWNRPVMLLYAVATENLVKALRIAQGVPVVTNGKLDVYFRDHDLLKFASDGGMCPRADEAELLQRLQDVLEAGKYPVSTHPSKNLQALRYASEDRERVWTLLERTDAALRATGVQCVPPFDVRKLGRQ
jgi:hypothetical protein